MIVVSPAQSEPRMVLRTDMFAQAVSALGTSSYGSACFRVFEQCFDVDHWALFRYRTLDDVRCIATASRSYVAQAEKNVGFFVTRCHRFDPSLLEFKRQHAERPCLIKMGIADIVDRQYRHCFETTNVQERLSFFAADGTELLQLCIYRAAVKRTFSAAEMNLFSTLARLVIAASVKHEALWENPATARGELDVSALERRLEALDAGLSRREVEVCARAITGSTIDDTARDLNIKKTSVITYRHRAYQKLGITRQNELVALICNLRSSSDPLRDDANFAAGPLRVQ